ncbi:hypothetical protein [Citrobacter telavivensis]
MCATDGIIYPGYPYHTDNKNMIILPEIEEQTGKITQDCLKTLVVFVGGCADDAFQPMLTGVFSYHESNFGQGTNRIQDVCYSEWGCGKVPPIMQKWYDAKQKIVLVGHSWGGDGVIRLAEKNPAIEIELLVTLDPVSRTKNGKQPKPQNVKRWLNVYVDYTKADNSTANIVARTGGAWASCEHADENIIVNVTRYIDSSGNPCETINNYGHANAYEMYLEVYNEIIKI